MIPLGPGLIPAASEAPLLSIITPVFNGAKHISACIDCVVAQNCARIEHIIVDGASTDGTTTVVREKMRLHPHIRLVSEPDKGQSDAMNKGIKLARADYIGFLNVDDFYEPGALARIVGVIDTLQEPHFIVGNLNVLGENDALQYVNRPRVLALENILVDDREWPFPQNPASYFYPKSLHERVGYYDTSEQFALDFKFLLAAIQNTKMLYIDDVLGNFRRVPGTKTFSIMKDRSLGRILRRVRREAFLRAPIGTKLRVVSLWLTHNARRRYWEFHRRRRALRH